MIGFLVVNKNCQVKLRHNDQGYGVIDIEKKDEFGNLVCKVEDYINNIVELKLIEFNDGKIGVLYIKK